MGVAIIGGTGFIGPQIAARVLARGLQPLVIARGHHPVTLPSGAVFEAADRMDTSRLVELFRTYSIGTVIDVFTLSLRNTKPVIDAIGITGGRYVPLSSVDVYRNYGGLLGRETPPVQLEPAREEDPLRGFRYPYRDNSRRPQGVESDLFEDYDKIFVEDHARADDRFETTIIRAPMIFGPGDKQHRFRWAIEAVLSDQPIRIDRRAARWGNSYGYGEDIAEAIVLAALALEAAGRTYNVGQPFVRTPVEWLHTFAAHLNRPIKVIEVDPSDRGLLVERAEAMNLAYPLTLDTARIRTELGFTEIVSEPDALDATIAYEQPSLSQGG
jgi:nucleoside-diphosphate-sugar epimerase